MTVDRAEFSPVVLISKHGGVDIESSRQNNGGKLHKLWFSVGSGIDDNVMSDMIRNRWGSTILKPIASQIY